MRPEVERAVSRLSEFLGSDDLTTVVAGLEHALAGADGPEASDVARRYGVDVELLAAASAVRRAFGRVSDVIHAAGILLLLPMVLEPGETISNRPSLAAGNDPSRQFDLETNLRVAEFKFAMWVGRDAMRKRGEFKDLVRLAADPSGRRPDLFVVGPRPAHFLRTTKAKAKWGLDRAGLLRELYAQRFGSMEVTIADFRTGPGARVNIVDVEPILPPGVLAALQEDEVE